MQHTAAGRPVGRPAVGNVSKYLLTNLAICGCCQGSLKALSRSQGTSRKFFYGCAGYPFHDLTLTVTHCGRICFKNREINLSHVFAGQTVGVTQVGDRIWLVTFMHCDLGYFDDATCRLEPIENPFGPKVFKRPTLDCKSGVGLFSRTGWRLFERSSPVRPMTELEFKRRGLDLFPRTARPRPRRPHRAVVHHPA